MPILILYLVESSLFCCFFMIFKPFILTATSHSMNEYYHEFLEDHYEALGIVFSLFHLPLLIVMAIGIRYEE